MIIGLIIVLGLLYLAVGYGVVVLISYAEQDSPPLGCGVLFMLVCQQCF